MIMIIIMIIVIIIIIMIIIICSEVAKRKVYRKPPSEQCTETNRGKLKYCSNL